MGQLLCGLLLGKGSCIVGGYPKMLMFIKDSTIHRRP
jgi:hypothetical protein